MSEAEVLLEARGLTHEYPSPGQAPLPVLAGLDLQVREGEIAAVIGPSGSGKSTLLNILAALDTATGGEVHVGSERGVAYMPQKDLLFPWRTIEDNAIL